MALFDIHMVSQVLLVAFIGGLIGLDRTALGQFMISQPVVAGPLTGWVLGDATTGLIIGGALELVWVLDMPIGTFVPADSTVAAVSATAIAVLGSESNVQLPVIGFTLLLTVAMVPVTMAADHVMRKQNSRLPDLAISSAGRTSGGRVACAHLVGLAAFFLKSFVLCLALVYAGLAALSLFFRMPEKVHRAMALFITLLPFLGVATVARRLSRNTLDRFLLIGFVTAAIAVQLLHGPAAVVILLAAGAGWVGVRYHGA